MKHKLRISYNGLCKKLIDSNMKKDLVEILNIGLVTIAKTGEGGQVSSQVLNRICTYFNCNIGDVMSFGKKQ